jgi:hypothetical protein
VVAEPQAPDALSDRSIEVIDAHRDARAAAEAERRLRGEDRMTRHALGIPHGVDRPGTPLRLAVLRPRQQVGGREVRVVRTVVTDRLSTAPVGLAGAIPRAPGEEAGAISTWRPVTRSAIASRPGRSSGARRQERFETQARNPLRHGVERDFV